MVNLGLFSDLFGTAIFLILSLLLLFTWRGNLLGAILGVCALISSFWFLYSALTYSFDYVPSKWFQAAELVRDFAWLIFLGALLKKRPSFTLISVMEFIFILFISILGITVLLIVIYPTIQELLNIDLDTKNRYLFISFLLIALSGCSLSEKLYRNTKPDNRWSIKYLCFGIGGIFIYDLYIYSEALLFLRLNSDLLAARGFINSLCVPLIAISIARNSDWKSDLFVSRHVVYQSTTIAVVGIYLICMAVAGYYVRNYGGSWGNALQTIFLFAAIMALFVLVLSADIRARIKIFLVKHFYSNKYDYREVWLGVTKAISSNVNEEERYIIIIEAMAKIINSNGGALWLTEDNMDYSCKGMWRLDIPKREIGVKSEMVEFINETRWIINLEEYRASPAKYNNIKIEGWLTKESTLWLIVPLFINEKLVGIVMLCKPTVEISFNWEDRDLLNTVGYQVASYISLLKLTDELAQAKQFEAFSRMSAYVVHDLKNLIAQLSLISANARRFRDKQEFIDDAFETIDNSVIKIKKLLVNLKKGDRYSDSNLIKCNINSIISDVIDAKRISYPLIEFIVEECDQKIDVAKDRIRIILEHIIQNAVDAVKEEGIIRICSNSVSGMLSISIKDNGHGMNDEFINNRLFKPFDTTKGNAGMGIGVYESREIVRELGGELNVTSKPDNGTTFIINIPLNENLAKNQ